MVKTKKDGKKTTAAKAAASATAKKQPAGKGKGKGGGKSNGAAKTDKSKPKTRQAAKKTKDGAATKEPTGTRTNEEMANEGGVGETLACGLVLRKERVISQNGKNPLCVVLGCHRTSLGVRTHNRMCNSHYQEYLKDDVAVAAANEEIDKEKALIDKITSDALAVMDPANARKIEKEAEEDVARKKECAAAILSPPSVLTNTVKKHTEPMKAVRALMRAGDTAGAMALMQGREYQRMLGDSTAIDSKLHYGEDLSNDCYIGGSGCPWAVAMNPMSAAVAKFLEGSSAFFKANTRSVPPKEVQAFLTSLKKKGPKGARFYVIGMHSNKAEFFGLEAAAKKLKSGAINAAKKGN